MVPACIVSEIKSFIQTEMATSMHELNLYNIYQAFFLNMIVSLEISENILRIDYKLILNE